MSENEIDDELGGDPACWANVVCDECGKIMDAQHRHADSAGEGTGDMRLLGEVVKDRPR